MPRVCLWEHNNTHNLRAPAGPHYGTKMSLNSLCWVFQKLNDAHERDTHFPLGPLGPLDQSSAPQSLGVPFRAIGRGLQQQEEAARQGPGTSRPGTVAHI